MCYILSMESSIDVESVLETIGLKDKEAKVYFACLQLGQETAFNIAQKSGVKRSTCYFVLDKLKERGFVSIKKTPKVTFYSAISPTTLLLKIEKQKDSLEKVMPELDKIWTEQPHKPLIQVFEGHKGVEQVYREAGEYIQKYQEFLYFGSTAHFLLNDNYKSLLDLYLKEMKNKRYRAREILVEEELKGSDYLKRIKENNNPNHQIRFFPRGIKFFENDNMIYGNKLAIFSLKKEVFVILIESENIAASYRNLFEMAWKVSKPVE